MYNIILKFGYYEKMVIENVRTSDLNTIIPLVSRLKYFDNDTEKESRIEIEVAKAVVEDGESN